MSNSSFPVVNTELLKRLAVERGKKIEIDQEEYFHKNKIIDSLTVLQQVVFELNQNNEFIYLSDTSLDCLAFYNSEQALTEQRFIDFVLPDDQFKVNKVLKAVENKINSIETIKFRPKTTPHIWLEVQLCALKQKLNNGERFAGIVGILRDVTEKEVELNYINFLAYHDTLTGLPNMFWLEDRWSQILAEIQEDQKLFFILLDVDDFNEINEYFGQKIGDRALLAIARKLKTLLSQNSYLLRWQGDKFVILAISPEKDFMETFSKSLKKIETEIITIEDVSFFFHITGGYITYPEEELSSEELFGKAHSAMLYAKEELRNEIVSFKDIQFKNKEKFNLFTLKNSLAEAIHTQKIKTFFQPQIEAKSMKLVGFEALARWRSEDLGHIPPNVFVSVAEKHGLISQLGYLILSKSLEFVSELKKNNIGCKVAANISQRQLFSSDLVSDIAELTKKYRLDNQSIILEITESISMSNEKNIITRLEQLRTNGFQISIDDFGTRYSSLSRLHSMPVSELKIDMSFIARLHTEKGLKMVQAIYQLAKALGLRTVAEGVEDAKSVAVLREIGVDFLQGYYFSPAMDFDAAVEYAQNFNTLNQEYIHLFGP